MTKPEVMVSLYVQKKRKNYGFCHKQTNRQIWECQLNFPESVPNICNLTCAIILEPPWIKWKTSHWAEVEVVLVKSFSSQEFQFLTHNIVPCN